MQQQTIGEVACEVGILVVFGNRAMGKKKKEPDRRKCPVCAGYPCKPDCKLGFSEFELRELDAMFFDLDEQLLDDDVEDDDA